MLVITSGSKYTDIDALSSCYAYKKLKDIQGIKAVCLLTEPINESFSKSMRNWGVEYETTLPSENDFKYVIIDISDPKYFSNFVDEDQVVELIDHHFGFENYWHKKIGDNAQIEKIGACATQIWGKYIETGLDKKIDTLSANLLYTTIVSHTLNFKVGVTTPRDIKAAHELEKYISLPSNWIETYFHEIEESLLADPERAMINDTKTPEINSKRYFIVQLELWDSRKFIKNNLNKIKKYLDSSKEDFAFFTSPSISEGKNYLIARDKKTREILEKNIGADFSQEIGKTDKLMLRKEIIKAFLMVK